MDEQSVDLRASPRATASRTLPGSATGLLTTGAASDPMGVQSSATMPAVSRAIASFIDAASTAPYPTRR